MSRIAHKARLTTAETMALTAVADGGDVLSWALARCLRGIEAKRPDLVVICPPMGTYSETDRLPFFGAVCTDEGRRVVEQEFAEVTP